MIHNGRVTIRLIGWDDPLLTLVTHHVMDYEYVDGVWVRTVGVISPP